MLNYIWGFMILAGIIAAAWTGKLPDVTDAAIEASVEAVSVCISMLGIVSMWSGLIKIAEKAGIVDAFTKKAAPFIKFLFPGLPMKSKAVKYISTNMVANILGLGWAATPAGLMAMEELQKLNKNKETASRDMCTFLIINMSSLQLITISVISDRAMYNSTGPSEIIVPGLLATLASTVAAVIFVKIMGKAAN